MKKTNMMRMLLCLVMMAISVNNADAQGLKGLKSKLGSALGGAVGGTVGGAVGNAVGGPVGSAIGKKNTPQPANQNSVATTAAEDNYNDYNNEDGEEQLSPTAKLVDQTELGELQHIFSLCGYENSKEITPIPNMKYVILSRPGYFATSFINKENKEEEAAKTFSDSKNTLFTYKNHSGDKHNDLLEKHKQKSINMAEQNAKYRDIGMELFTVMQQRGINPEKATEDQMRAIGAEIMGKKIGIPAAEMEKISKMSESQAEAYVRSKYPAAAAKASQLGLVGQGTDDDEDEELEKYFDKLEQELDSLYAMLGGTEEQQQNELDQRLKELEKIQQNPLANAEKLQDIIRQGRGELYNELYALNKEIRQSWVTSEECQKIEQEEKKLQARLEKWMKDNSTGYNDEFPSWWETEHNALNVYVKQWNEKQAACWTETLKQREEKLLPILKRVAEIETEINDIPVEKALPAFMLFRQHLVMFNQFLDEYMSLPLMILDCPTAGEIVVIETV